MTPRFRGFLLLFGAAAVVGVYDGVSSHLKATRAAAPPSAVQDPVVAAPRAASRDELKSALATLESALEPATRDPAAPALLAEGALTFGVGHRASDGRLARDLVSEAAAHGQRDALLDALLTLGEPAPELVKALRADAKPPETDADFQRLAWTLSALVAAAKLDGAGPDLSETTERALARIERDQRVVTEWSGAPDHAFDEGTPLARAKRERTAIYSLPGDGLPLFRAVARSVAASKDEPRRRRLRKQLGVLILRYELERTAYASLLARHPEQATLIRARELAVFGQMLETFVLARSLPITEPASEGGHRVDQTLRFVSGDLASAVDGLGKSGALAHLDELAKQHPDRHAELVSDGCLAIRALRAALESS